MRKKKEDYIRVLEYKFNPRTDKIIVITKKDVPKEITDECVLDVTKGSTFTLPDIIKEILILHDSSNERKNIKHEGT